MAEQTNVPGKRSFLFIILVSIVTCGIYWIYWYYKTNAEMKDYLKVNCSPGGRLAVLIFGFILLGLPSIYVYYLWLRDADAEAKKAGLDGFSPIVNLILLFIPFGTLYTTYKVQATLNDIWDATTKKSSGRAQAYAQSQTSQQDQPQEKVVVLCTRCKSTNPAGSNYCIKCGQNLV
ncbi:MAG: DUF4234 domain-containing protein [Candidatus ainarchaeum sp.]|nr:DUF4234 domain-containing protein [Candidatus ainarchaeum sp.]